MAHSGTMPPGLELQSLQESDANSPSSLHAHEINMSIEPQYAFYASASKSLTPSDITRIIAEQGPPLPWPVCPEDKQWIFYQQRWNARFFKAQFNRPLEIFFSVHVCIQLMMGAYTLILFVIAESSSWHDGHFDILLLVRLLLAVLACLQYYDVYRCIWALMDKMTTLEPHALPSEEFKYIDFIYTQARTRKNGASWAFFGVIPDLPTTRLWIVMRVVTYVIHAVLIVWLFMARIAKPESVILLFTYVVSGLSTAVPLVAAAFFYAGTIITGPILSQLSLMAKIVQRAAARPGLRVDVHKYCSDSTCQHCTTLRARLPLQCPLCPQQLEPDTFLGCIDGCGHFFHIYCLRQWVEKGAAVCPLCGTLVSFSFARQRTAADADRSLWKEPCEKGRRRYRRERARRGTDRGILRDIFNDWVDENKTRQMRMLNEQKHA